MTTADALSLPPEPVAQPDSVEPLRVLTDQLVGLAPTAALFVGVLLGGLVGASVLRRIAVWAAEKSGLDGLAERAGAARVLYAVGIKRSVAHVLGTTVWLAALLITLAAAAEILGLSAVTTAVSGVVVFLPRLVAAAGLVVAGAALASLLRSVVRRVSKRDDEVDSPPAIASLVYYVVVTVSVLVAADQAGLETGLVDDLVTASLAIGLAGVALAFALGSRDAFRNLVAGHYLRRLIHTGDEVEIEGHRGVVVRFSPVAVVLRTERGQRIVPTRSLLDGTIEIVASAGVPRAASPEAHAVSLSAPGQ